MTDNDEKQNKKNVPEKKERVNKKSDEAKKRASFSDRKKKEKERKEQTGPLVHEQSDISEHVHSHTIDDNIVAFERKKEKKKRLKNAGVVTKAITRYEPAPEEGLTDEQVAERINEGAVNAIVKINVGNDNVITADITVQSVKELGLAVGKEVYAVIKATNVMVGVE